MKTGRKKIAAFVGVATLGMAGMANSAWAQALEKQKVSIAVGGKNLFYYLPLTIAEQQGYFKDEGLQVEISDFAGGAKALQALVGGSADVVSGAYEHTINMQAKGQMITPSCCRAGRRRSSSACQPRPCPTTSPSPT